MKAMTLLRASAILFTALGTACTNGALGAPESEATSAQAVDATGNYGWVWANESSGDYTPSGAYSFNSAGKTNHVSAIETGHYVVKFPGIQTNGGNAQVAAYGSTNAHCKVGSWSSAEQAVDLSIDVFCYAPDGHPVNSTFVVSFYTPKAGDVGAFLWANDPTAASYQPMAIYSWSSGGGTHTITRGPKGTYTALLRGVSDPSGNVVVTAYGMDDANRCKIDGWVAADDDERVGVLCFDAHGQPADARFSLSFVGGGTLPSPHDWGAYARANQPLTASYVPGPSFTASSELAGLSPSQWQTTAKRIGVGHYTITYPYMPTSNKTMALATAIGANANYCNVSSWVSDGDAGTIVGVRCYDAQGAPAESAYAERYLYNSFLVF